MVENCEYGDRIEVHTMKEIYEGIYLPSPETGIILLKLDNGYNIGFIKKNISKLELVKKKDESKPLFEVVRDGGKPTIGLVVLGGTISSRLNPGKGGVDFVETPEDLFQFYPELFNKVNVKVEVPFMKGSEDMDYKDWQKVAKVVKKMLDSNEIRGVIVTQGTDTLHYTSAALSFFLQDLNKPVVLTYSQRSIDRASSDASLNLECAANVSLSDVCEVVVVGHANSDDEFCYAIRGTKVRKMHASRRDAFKPINSESILKVNKDYIEIISEYKKRGKEKPKIDTSFEEKVAILKFYPGQSPDILDYYLEKGYKGIIIETLGLGQIATSGARLSWIRKLKEMQDKGIVICATAQTIYGRLNPLVYVTGRELLKSGIIYLEDMLTEVAFVKLGWVLSHPEWNVKEKMLENISGEFNKRIVE
ncbi:Glu-tRNA(Gln) amidotransferase subunit GatD [archaeon]|nr:Glu-tRNA(Gln) amidotransferase subunit GatD [archaeon]